LGVLARHPLDADVGIGKIIVTIDNTPEEQHADADAPESDAEVVVTADDESAAADEEAVNPDEEPAAPAVVDDGIKRRWYALHAYSGQEANVKKNILIHAEQGGLKDVIGDVLVPMEEVAEIKSGEKKISKRKFFPGYVLIQLPVHPERNPELWHLIKETPGVSGFIGSRTVPVPLDDGEVQAILEELRGERERPKPKVKFEHGERVKIIDGPFSNFLGNIDEINAERGTLKVMVEIFERLTSVEVEFWQVEKV
jgi:transcriptional antiterminator NusG